MALTIVVLTALALAGPIALFKPLYSLLLSPLPLHEPDRLVRLGGGLPLFNIYTRRFDHPERFHGVFQRMAAYAPVSGVSAYWRPPGADRDVLLRGLAVTPEFFETLGIVPEAGGTLQGQSDAAPSVVVSHRSWRELFAADIDVVGTHVAIGGRVHRIAGVLPEGLSFPEGIDAWVPIETTSFILPDLEMIARLAAGASIGETSQALTALRVPPAISVAGQYVSNGPAVQLLHAYVRGSTRTTLSTLAAVAGAFFLLSCVGIANVLLVHCERRRSHVLIALALGATRVRLVRRMLADLVLVLCCGAIVGLLLSVVGSRWLQGQLPEVIVARPAAPAIAAVALGLVLVVTLICGVPTALFGTRHHHRGLLRAAGERAGASRISRTTAILAVVEVGLCLALLTCGAQLAQNLYLQVRSPLGFEPTDVFTFQATLPPSIASPVAPGKSEGRERTVNRRLEGLRRNSLFVERLTERLRSVRGVADVAILQPAPFTPEAAIRARLFAAAVSTQSTSGDLDNRERVPSIVGYATPSAFEALEVPLLAGRSFSNDDVEHAATLLAARVVEPSAPRPPHAAIINEALARRLWPNEYPVGRRFNTHDSLQPYIVVGVIGNYRWTPGVPPDRPTVYFPYSGGHLPASYIIRISEGNGPSGLSRQLSAAIEGVSTEAPVAVPHGLLPLVDARLRNLRLAALLVGVAALIGTCVALLGVYSATSLLVAAKAREWGIRLALGATPAAVRRQVLSQVGLFMIGVPVGWLGGWLLARQVGHWVVDQPAPSLATYAVGGGIVAASVLAACLGPMLRAGRTEPARVLQQDQH